MRTTRHRALTLVEVMCATLVGAAVASIGAGIAVHILRLNGDVRTELRDRWSEERVIEQFRTDIRDARLDFMKSEKTAAAPAAAGTLLEFAALSALGNPASAITHRAPQRIQYKFPAGNSTVAAGTLMRTTQPIEDTQQTIAGEILAQEVSGLRIEHFSEDAWIPLSSPILNADKAPQALRLVLSWADRYRPNITCTAVLPDRAGSKRARNQ